jgi:hypothetical protein
MIETICAVTYGAGPVVAKVAGAWAMMAGAMLVTPIALDAAHAVRRWRQARRER